MERNFGLVDSLNTRTSLKVGDKGYYFFSIKTAAQKLSLDVSSLPYSLRILLENLLRFEDGVSVKLDDIKEIGKGYREYEIAFRPTRVLIQDFTGVPAVVDLAAMRDAMVALCGDPRQVNPLIPVDLVIDHSVQVDAYGTENSFATNVAFEMQRNYERYKFLRWGQQSFSNFRVVPPGTGICHQVNLEYLAKVIWTEEIDGKTYAYPDTLVGTDSHTTMINGLSVLGWGVGGIEAEAAMLGQPLSMLIPEVVGMKLTGTLKEGVTATDLVLTITNMLRAKGVVGKFVEFYGNGLADLSLANRATIANMAPEYGATCGFFPIDAETLKYLALTGKSKEHLELVEAYAKEQGLWYNPDEQIKFNEVLELDLSTVEPTIAGPKRPQDGIRLAEAPANFRQSLPDLNKNEANIGKKFPVGDGKYSLSNGDIVIAAITSCTNTSNPYVMIGAGLLARNAVQKGLSSKPWVKTSLAPGSQVVTEYFKLTKLDQYLAKMGFNLVGYGCTTCIGNSGPLLPEIEKAIFDNNLVACSVLSGNRNFEGRVHPLVRANYLASPMLCVAYAIAGSIHINLISEAIAKDKNGKDVYLRDIWPTDQEINEFVNKYLGSEVFKTKYADVFAGTEEWREITVSSSANYPWDPSSTYIKSPPYFKDINKSNTISYNISNARILAILGDSITTDHISPAGSIAKDSPAAKYLIENNVSSVDFNSYGARRGNHEVMMRGTFANIRIKNKLAGGIEGGYTKYFKSGEVLPIYDAAMRYAEDGIPLVIFAGKEYGTGSSRDWAAKGTNLLGVKAVIAESFERIHRSNLVGMGVIPVVFEKVSIADLNLVGDELIDIEGLENIIPKKKAKLKIKKENNPTIEVDLICRIDTESEVSYIQNGGILQYVLKKLRK
ncbi:MAG: aconitate hydratase AcnA [Candidatus Midichloria sp.]|uniref:aconitate hydratase n=1 Tax=Hyalomma marginatum TaxID=34627 RepID=A0A8S4BT96_9ACAR|nr:aconitate hydratase AcnA [Hyalomma marginatum]CAG7589995.1 aconitate hydratase AcnA [Hyalomma marginatum]